ncbi:MAG: chalcone isomerase family protein [Myxococcales bacterium]|nr:chalcone isomerase family protein [Myxococcales bacterium]
MKRYAMQMLTTTTACLLVLASVSPAHARECADVRMPGTAQVDGTTLTLNGMGIREATVFNVNVYVAGLYLESRSRDGAAILASAQRKRIVLHFVREVERGDVHEAFREGLESGHVDAATIRRFLSWIPAASEGSRFTFTYVPGTGTEVRIGRRVRGTIEGEAFARAFFGIWLGSEPPNAGLKRGLLGGSCG